MQILSGKTKEETAGFIYFTAFMQTFSWEVVRDFIPIKRDTKQISRTRKEMEHAASYLAQAETGKSVDPKKVEQALAAIKNWKHYFIENLQSKPDIQLINECLNHRINGVFNSLLPTVTNEVDYSSIRGQYLRRIFNKNYKSEIKISIASKIFINEKLDFNALLAKVPCSHDDNSKHLLGKKGASALADNLFKSFFDNEVKAFAESGINKYWAREAGSVEYGETIDCKGPQYIPRQFAEIPSGEFYKPEEDESATSWKMVSDTYDTYFSNDEIVEKDLGTYLVIDYQERNDKYFDLRRDLLHAKSFDQIQKILIKANNLAKTDILSDWMYNKLRYFANDVHSYRMKQKRLKHV